jgi:hypothetical protein
MPVETLSVGGQVNVGSVPEPATWAMLLIGLGATGATLRSRRRVIAAQA